MDPNIFHSYQQKPPDVPLYLPVLLILIQRGHLATYLNNLYQWNYPTHLHQESLANSASFFYHCFFYMYVLRFDFLTRSMSTTDRVSLDATLVCLDSTKVRKTTRRELLYVLTSWQVYINPVYLKKYS